MTRKKEFVCIVCPNSCQLAVEYDDEALTVEGVSGNTCPKGVEYAEHEIKNPLRTLTTTVRVKGGALRLTSVRSSRPIPKARLKEAVKLVSGLEITAPVHVGDVVVPDLFGTGADVCVSKEMG